MNLFPSLYATAKASTYFATTRDGFEDTEGRFKMFLEHEAPSAEGPFITVDFQPEEQDRNNDWNLVTAIFHVNGKETEWDDLCDIADELYTMYKDLDVFTAVGSDTAQSYQLVGRAVFDRGRDPVLETVNRSVALQFGLA